MLLVVGVRVVVVLTVVVMVVLVEMVVVGRWWSWLCRRPHGRPVRDLSGKKPGKEQPHDCTEKTDRLQQYVNLHTRSTSRMNRP